MAERTVAAEADDTRAGMTLGELADMLAEARLAGCPDDVVVRMRATFRGSIRRAGVTWDG